MRSLCAPSACRLLRATRQFGPKSVIRKVAQVAFRNETWAQYWSAGRFLPKSGRSHPNFVESLWSFAEVGPSSVELEPGVPSIGMCWTRIGEFGPISTNIGRNGPVSMGFGSAANKLGPSGLPLLEIDQHPPHLAWKEPSSARDRPNLPLFLSDPGHRGRWNGNCLGTHIEQCGLSSEVRTASKVSRVVGVKIAVPRGVVRSHPLDEPLFYRRSLARF